jgi:hypothetical protein
MKPNPVWLAMIAGVICIPVLFAAVGGSQGAGLAVGVVLVLIGVIVSLRER